MNDPLCLFQLDLPSLHEVRSALTFRVQEGLEGPGRQIAALPAWLPPPAADLTGRAVVVDTGGTHMRAALVDLDRGGARVVAGPVEADVPTGREGQAVDGDAFFQAQARLVERLGPGPGLPVGYCFSYPAEVLPDGDAVLLRWTKGLNISGVEGTRVGSRLGQALADLGLQPGPVRVLNDTVAALLAGAWAWRDQDFPTLVGLIVGTGTNMATFLPRSAIPKLGTSDPGRIAVNLESGNFAPPHLSEFDEAVDALSANEGRQRFEKAVSGLYLPQVFQRVMPGILAPGDDTRALSRLRSEGSSPESALARALLDRSADLVAAALAGLADLGPEGGRLGVVAEGTLFWGAPGYAERVRHSLSALVGDRAFVGSVQSANLVGSACAARVEMG